MKKLIPDGLPYGPKPHTRRQSYISSMSGDIWTAFGWVLLAILAIPSCASNGAQGTAPTGGKHALVIGNERYRHVSTALNSRNDAEEICKALKLLEFEVQCPSELETIGQFEDELTMFSASLKPDSVALVYFAGHGSQAQNRNYVWPTDIRANEGATGFPIQRIFEVIERRNPGLGIYIFDACRVPPETKTTDIDLPTNPKVSFAKEDKFPAGSELIFSTAPNTYAYPQRRGPHGIYTAHFLAMLKERPGMRIGPFFDETASRVDSDETYATENLRPIPYRTSSFHGRFCFAACDDLLPAPPWLWIF